MKRTVFVETGKKLKFHKGVILPEIKASVMPGRGHESKIVVRPIHALLENMENDGVNVPMARWIVVCLHDNGPKTGDQMVDLARMHGMNDVDQRSYLGGATDIDALETTIRQLWRIGILDSSEGRDGEFSLAASYSLTASIAACLEGMVKVPWVALDQ